MRPSPVCGAYLELNKCLIICVQRKISWYQRSQLTVASEKSLDMIAIMPRLGAYAHVAYKHGVYWYNLNRMLGNNSDYIELPHFMWFSWFINLNTYLAKPKLLEICSVCSFVQGRSSMCELLLHIRCFHSVERASIVNHRFKLILPAMKWEIFHFTALNLWHSFTLQICLCNIVSSRNQADGWLGLQNRFLHFLNLSAAQAQHVYRIATSVV